MVKVVRILFIFVLSFQWAFVHADEYTNQEFVALEEKSKNSPTLVLQAGDIAQNSQISVTNLENVNQQDVADFLQQKELQKSDIILSTDSETTFNTVAKSVVKDNKTKFKDRFFRFIPIGKLAPDNEKISSSWNTYKKNAKHTLMYDKIGLTVVVITTAFDSIIWIHSADLAIHHKSAMVMLNVLFAASFGLDRDLWTRMTTPMRHKIMNTLDKYGGRFLKNADATKLVASQFAANLALSTGFQLLRASILSMDHLYAAVSTTEFWTKSILLGTLMTASTFAWGELAAAVDVERNPVAKVALKRLADFRVIMMSQLASMGMVLQPQIYGSAPIIALAIHGGLGLLALAKAQSVTDWLEKNKTANRVYKHQMSLEELMNTALRLDDIEMLEKKQSAIGSNSCHMLFAN